MEAQEAMAAQPAARLGGPLILSPVTAERLDRCTVIAKHVGQRHRGGSLSKAVLQELDLVRKEEWPRNVPAYEVIASRFPEFSWRSERGTPRGCTHARRWVVFDGYPTVARERPSLADLVLESFRPTLASDAPPHIIVDLFAPQMQRRIAPLLNAVYPGRDDTYGAAFARTLVDLPIAFPPLRVMEAVRGWWDRALRGEPSTIVTPVCPDYATRETGDPLRPTAYTFDALGCGIGLVARRALAAIPKLSECFRTSGVRDVRFVIAMGDFEADSAETCARVGISRDEFLNRLRDSQAAFAAACAGVSVETPLITEIDRPRWEALLTEARAAVARRDYGPFGLTENDIALIVKARQSLYARWYGEDVDARAVLDRQAPEYMAASALVQQHYPNALVFGADATAMAPFAQGIGSVIQPVLYLRHVAY